MEQRPPRAGGLAAGGGDGPCESRLGPHGPKQCSQPLWAPSPQYVLPEVSPVRSSQCEADWGTRILERVSASPVRRLTDKDTASVFWIVLCPQAPALLLKGFLAGQTGGRGAAGGEVSGGWLCTRAISGGRERAQAAVPGRRWIPRGCRPGDAELSFPGLRDSGLWLRACGPGRLLTGSCPAGLGPVAPGGSSPEAVLQATVEQLMFEEKNKAQRLQTELDVSEQVQRDFVKLSQTLQVRRDPSGQAAAGAGFLSWVLLAAAPPSLCRAPPSHRPAPLPPRPSSAGSPPRSLVAPTPGRVAPAALALDGRLWGHPGGCAEPSRLGVRFPRTQLWSLWGQGSPVPWSQPLAWACRTAAPGERIAL